MKLHRRVRASLWECARYQRTVKSIGYRQANWTELEKIVLSFLGIYVIEAHFAAATPTSAPLHSA